MSMTKSSIFRTKFAFLLCGAGKFQTLRNSAIKKQVNKELVCTVLVYDARVVTELHDARSLNPTRAHTTHPYLSSE
eukprot:3307391-Amphidinium_carterae.1